MSREVLGCERGQILAREVSEVDCWLPLKQGASGLLLLDLTQDWASASQQCPVPSATSVGGAVGDRQVSSKIV